MSIQRPASAGTKPAPAQQPYTRRAHGIDDQLLPLHHARRHHVDIRVLDALARQLEGWHRAWIALEIRELAGASGVSQASVSRALGRLEAADVILRRKKITQRGRYIWEIALGEAYRTSASLTNPEAIQVEQPGVAGSQTRPRPLVDDSSVSPCHVTVPWHGDAPSKEKEERNLDHHHAACPPLQEAEAPLSQEDQEALWRSRLGTSAPRLATPHSTRSRPQQPELTQDQRDLLHKLTDQGVSWFIGRTWVREKPLEILRNGLTHLAELELRGKSPSRPAGWLSTYVSREGEGYSLPLTPSKKQKQAAQEIQRHQLELQEQKRQTSQDEETAYLLEIFQNLPPDHQRELEVRARATVGNWASKIPLDLTCSGPIRAQLLDEIRRKLVCHTVKPTQAA